MATIRVQVRKGLALAMVAVLGSMLVIATPATPAHATAGVDFDNLTEAQWRNFLRDHTLAMNVPSSTVTGGKDAKTPGDVGRGMTRREMRGVRAKAAQRNATQKVRPRVAGQPKQHQVVLPQTESKRTPQAKGSGWKARLFNSARGLGNALFLGFVFDVTYTSTGAALEAVTGVQTDGFACDFQRLTSWELGACGMIADPEYIPNSDIEAIVEGWVTGNIAQSFRDQPYPAYRFWDDVILSANVINAPKLPLEGREISVEGMVALAASLVQPTSNMNGPNDYPARVSVVEVTAAGEVVQNVCGPSVNVAGGGTVPWSCAGQLNNLGNFYEVHVLSPRTTGWSPQTTLRWVPQGHPDWVAGQDGDPWREWQTVWRCEGPTGSPVEFSSTSSPWRESDEVWPEPPTPHCEEGSLVYARVDQITEGVAEPWTLWEWEEDPVVRDWMDTYPECADGTCLLLLHRLDHQLDQRVSCFQSPDPCAKWIADPQRELNYVCTYGKHDVDLEECFAYATLFDRDKRKHADPDDGEEAPDEDEGWVPTPRPPGAPVPAPEIGTPDPNCPPPFSWLSLFNPWWYYQGVACALQAAFVPSGDVVSTEVDRVRDSFDSRPPGSIIGVAGPVIQSVGHGWTEGCGGAIADFGTVHGSQLLIPCNPPASTDIQTARAVLAIAIVITTAFALWHMTVAAIGGNTAENG